MKIRQEREPRAATIREHEHMVSFKAAILQGEITPPIKPEKALDFLHSPIEGESAKDVTPGIFEGLL